MLLQHSLILVWIGILWVKNVCLDCYILPGRNSAATEVSIVFFGAWLRPRIFMKNFIAEGAFMNEKKKSLKVKMIVLLCCLVTALACLSVGVIYFSQNNNLKYEQAKQDVTLTLDAILNRTKPEEIYISGMFFNENSYHIFSDNEAGAAISDHIEYKIKKFNFDKDNESVEISIHSPDVYKILVEIVEKDHSFDNTEELLKSVLECLTSTYPTIENTIECSMEYKSGHWYLKPNKELFNSFSGNLYGYYMNTGKNTLNDIVGGDDNDE